MPNRKRRTRAAPAARSRPRGRMPGPGKDLMGIRDTYRFQRTYVASSNTITAGSAFVAAVSFLQTTMPAALATYALTWDLFRFRSVRVRWVPYWNVNASNAATIDDELPLIARVPNYDDSTAPATFDTVCGQGGAIVERFTRAVSLTVRPHALGPQIVSTGSQPSTVLYPTESWYNTAALGSFPTTWPMCKYAISATASVPGNGRFDILFDVDLEFAQHVSG